MAEKSFWDGINPFSAIGSIITTGMNNDANRSNINNTNDQNAANVAATNETSIRIANSANALSRENAQNAMDYSERMSNTSYQRGVADMQAAGINPMLAAMKGGASSPTGQMAPVTTPNLQTATAIPRTTHYNDVYHSAQQGGKVAQEIENLRTSNLLLAENVTHEQLKQEWTKAVTKTEAEKEGVEQQRKHLYAAQTAKETNEVNRDELIRKEILSRIASNYGSTTHSYSAAALERARTDGQYSDNVRLKDMQDFILANPKLFPRLQAIGEGSNSARDVSSAISNFFPWKSNSSTTYPNGSRSSTNSSSRRW